MRGRFARTSIPLLLPAMLLLATAGCTDNEAANDAVDPPLGHAQPELVTGAEVLAGAHIASLDPHTMSGAEIEKVIGPGPRCEFRYTSTGDPILALKADAGADAAAGAVMLNGDLVALQFTDEEPGLALSAGDIRLTLPHVNRAANLPLEQQDTTMIFRVGEQMTVGYGGYFSCTGPA